MDSTPRLRKSSILVLAMGHWPSGQSCTVTIFCCCMLASAFADNTGKFLSECKYQGDGGKYRWKVKIDPQKPPDNNHFDYNLAPSQLFTWTGGRGTLLSGTPRQGRENQWIALKGRVAAMIVEGDGDIHLELVDASGGSAAKADVEIPSLRNWCALRKLA